MSAYSVRRNSGLILLLCFAVSLFCVVYPIYVIRPFRAQGARELALALVVARYRVGVTMVAALAAMFCVVYSRRRILAAFGALLVLGLAFLARVNVYELMFHPIPAASFSSASKVKLDAGEKVIAVKFGKVARAYPVRSMSYHHIANDTVDKFAIVATY